MLKNTFDHLKWWSSLEHFRNMKKMTLSNNPNLKYKMKVGDIHLEQQLEDSLAII
jgi:hypothetical protein